jgi:hypothetical protein
MTLRARSVIMLPFFFKQTANNNASLSSHNPALEYLYLNRGLSIVMHFL